ncbi:putative DNA helicase [Tanacetum coccineum]
MPKLTKAMCWERVVIYKDRLNQVSATIYRKPTSNECCENRQENDPPLCENNDDPDAINGSRDLKPEIIKTLIEVLDEFNELVKVFRTAKDMCVDKEFPEFKIRLYNNGNRMCYNASVSGSLGAIVYDSGPRSQNDFDIIIHMKDGHGWSPELKLMNNGSGVDAYISIEQNRLDYIQSKQDMFRSGYLQGVHDALLKGDSDGHDVGKRIILPASSTGGPRYIYKHYEDARAICRVHGNP